MRIRETSIQSVSASFFKQSNVCCVPLSVCLQVNPGECNIQKGNRGLPGPPGLQGEVGQKGKDSSCYW